MAVIIALDQSQIEDLAVVRDLDEALLRKAVDELRRLPVAPLSWSRLFHEVSIALPVPHATQSLFRQVLPFVNYLRSQHCSVSDLMRGVRLSLVETSRWSEEQNAKWLAVEPILTDFFSIRTIYLTACALDLSFEHVNLFRGARILTDIRPIFDEAATVIEAAVVSHTLRVRFENAEGRHELTFALEESDVNQISEQCKRALGKSRAALSLMTDAAKTPTIISGGSDA